MAKLFNFSKGKIGEFNAEKFLQKKHYKILEKNYKCKVGEIDLICVYKKILVFVEVKFREYDTFGFPREAVNKQKQSKIKRVASHFLMKNEIEYDLIRFDVIEILGEKIEHIENAFNY